MAYDIGILEDPIPGEKRGKGLQHLTSSYFTYDLAVFINREFRAMQAMARYAHARSATRSPLPILPGFRSSHSFMTTISACKSERKRESPST